MIFWTLSLVPALFTIWAVQDKKTFEGTEQPFSDDGAVDDVGVEEKRDETTKA